MTISIVGTPVATIPQMEQLATDPLNAGRTYPVSKSVFDHFFAKLTFLPDPVGEADRINQLLGTAFPSTEAGGMTRSCKCSSCSHEFTFADHIESSIRMGVHTPDELRQILTGPVYFLTVDTDRTREVICVKCGTKSVVPHCCYARRTYAYV